MTFMIGWDLGGANVKVACIEDGFVIRVAQIPCPVVAHRDKFDAAVAAASQLIPSLARHAVTMTGELSDVFGDRREGVGYLIDLLQTVTAGQVLRIYAGDAGLLDPEEAKPRVAEVASANWHASAAVIARLHQDALLIDIGTTTTDLIPIWNGAVAACGFTDAERLTEGELVYTGVVRTPVMAIAQTAPFAGRMQRIAAERFATMADVFRLTGDLADDADPYPAADQRGKSVAESAARLARMLGRDGNEAELDEWVALARYFAGCQLALIEDAARTVAAREALPAEAPVIGAGCGRFVARQLAKRLRRTYVNFADIIDCEPEVRDMAARCAPAVSIALLAELSHSPLAQRAGQKW